MKVYLSLLLFMFSISSSAQEIKVGSKLFSESVILGEMITQIVENEDVEVSYFKQLGGTRILWNALLAGEIDIYPDYTGTLVYEILGSTESLTIAELNLKLQPFGVQISESLGFNNTYSIGMLSQKAKELEINTISNLRKYPTLKYGVSNEFLNRKDGWPGLREAYALPDQNVTGLDHDLAYRGLESGNIDIIDLYSTDAEIEYYQIQTLKDDLDYFPNYDAVVVYRLDVFEKFPDLREALFMMEGSISEKEIVKMNSDVKLNGESEIKVASTFLSSKFGISTEREESTLLSRLVINTRDHLFLVGISLFFAIITAIPLGILAVKKKNLEQPVLVLVGILQTIPSLALLVFMIPLFGIGTLPAMAALFVYSLLPIVRNTHSGIKNISKDLIESANALGIPKSVILKKIELPLALPSILAGIKTSAVINVGTATLGALIGAGGYGQPILTGIRLDSIPLILEGAIPAAVLAILVQALFDLSEGKLISKKL